MKRSTPMKRTALQPRAPTKNKPPKEPQTHTQQASYAVKSIAIKGVYSVISRDACTAPILKSKPVRSEAYRRAVASLPCVICGIAGQSQAAHGSAGKGMGIKACDTTLFPACAARPGVAGCHARLDQGALFSKAVRHALEPAWAADTQRRIHAMGKWPKGVPYPHQQPEIAQ